MTIIIVAWIVGLLSFAAGCFFASAMCAENPSDKSYEKACAELDRWYTQTSH